MFANIGTIAFDAGWHGPEGMPDERTVRRWALNASHPFSPQYAHAREFGYHRMFVEILEIADDSTNDYIERVNETGERVVAIDHDHIARSKLRVETRKWFLARTLPKSPRAKRR